MKKAKIALLLMTVGMLAASGGCFSLGNILRFLGDTAGDAVFLGGID